MHRLIRVIAGLPRETTVRVEGRVTIGRAPDSDVQLDGADVSRRHANIELDSDGRCTLVDLGSTGGTFVRGRKVACHVLKPGDLVAIGRFRLRYEEVEGPAPEHRPPVKRGLEALRPTHVATGAAKPGPSRGAAPVSAHPRAVPSGGPQAPGSHRADVAAAADTCVETAGSEGAAESDTVIEDAEPRPEAVTLDPFRVRLETMDLVRAVHDYRWLRLQQLAHEILDYEELTRLDELERQLELGPTGDRGPEESRRRRRFGCAVPACIVALAGRGLSTIAVTLEDISVGGAQARLTDVLASGAACWLMVDLEDESPNPVVVFGAQVVWSLAQDHRLGLMFSGSVRSGVDGLELIRGEIFGAAPRFGVVPE